MDERTPKDPPPGMDDARQYVRAALASDRPLCHEGCTEIARQPVGEPPDDLKERINNLLFLTMPGPTTINEMESMACDIHENIMQAWRYAQAQEAFATAEPGENQ